MRTLTTALAASICLSAATISLPQDEAVKPMTVVESYHALAEASDMGGLVELFKANEYKALGMVDQDLEGSLSIWEGAPDAATTPDAIAELHKRALFGAKAASAAFDRPIFLDYASAFCSWNDDEKRDFRAGQAAFGEARGAFKSEDLEGARKAAEKCTELALPLGDWWGCAMGLGASGSAKIMLGDYSEALADLSRARLLNNGLGLRGSELANLKGMLTCLNQLGHTQRAITVCEELVEATDGKERLAFTKQLLDLESK